MIACQYCLSFVPCLYGNASMPSESWPSRSLELSEGEYTTCESVSEFMVVAKKVNCCQPPKQLEYRMKDAYSTPNGQIHQTPAVRQQRRSTSTPGADQWSQGQQQIVERSIQDIIMNAASECARPCCSDSPNYF